MARLDDFPPGRADGPRTYACADLARRIGRHPNTLRKYETWGFISPVPRAPNGYRVYSRRHALQAALAVTALRACFQDWEGRRRMKRLIALAVSSDFVGAGELLAAHRSDLGQRLERAVAARAIMERWKSGEGPESAEAEGAAGVMRGEAARIVGVAPDTLRDWERNALASPERLPNGRRSYSAGELEKLQVVRTLRQAGYSLMGLVGLFRGKSAIADLCFARDRWDQALRGLIGDCDAMEGILAELEKERRRK